MQLLIISSDFGLTTSYRFGDIDNRK